jgi:hypothetical protein
VSEEEREYLNEMIRSLNNQLVDALRERDEALKKIGELEDVCGDAGDRMVELVKERDEARRTLCFIQSQVLGCTPWYHADRQGWDCFKENDKEETK